MKDWGNALSVKLSGMARTVKLCGIAWRRIGLPATRRFADGVNVSDVEPLIAWSTNNLADAVKLIEALPDNGTIAPMRPVGLNVIVAVPASAAEMAISRNGLPEIVMDDIEPKPNILVRTAAR